MAFKDAWVDITLDIKRHRIVVMEDGSVSLAPMVDLKMLDAARFFCLGSCYETVSWQYAKRRKPSTRRLFNVDWIRPNDTLVKPASAARARAPKPTG